MSSRPDHLADPVVREFVAESPLNRSHIAAYVAAAARSLAPGSRVLDAGAGAAPYRSLFGHVDYVTSDWAESIHEEAGRSDIVAPLDKLPVDNASFDAVVSTEVLEHVADPGAVLGEFRRILKPGGRLWLTTPFVWELHEEPYDYFRYTEHALRTLLRDAGFEDVEVEPFGGYFTTLGQIVRHFGAITGRAERDAGLPARAFSQAMAAVGTALGRLDRFDRGARLPIGYGTSAVCPAVPTAR